MENTQQASSDEVEVIPDWKQWKRRFLDGYYEEYNHPEAEKLGYTPYPDRFSALIWKKKIRSKEQSPTIASCCGSRRCDVKEVIKHGFPGTPDKSIRDWASIVKTFYSHESYWGDNLGIFLGLNATADEAKNFFSIPEKDAIAVELPCGGEIHTLTYRGVFDAEHL